MHERYTRAMGTPVVEEDSFQTLGVLSDMLIHPDTGKIEGFSVTIRGFLSSSQLFLAAPDILHWGAHVTILHGEVLGLLEDHIRLASLVREERPILHQLIRTDTGRVLGHCRDVQFDTSSLLIEWLFPKHFFRWGAPVAASQILEVRKEAIIVKDPIQPIEEKQKTDPVAALLNQLPDAA